MRRIWSRCARDVHDPACPWTEEVGGGCAVIRWRLDRPMQQDQEMRCALVKSGLPIKEYMDVHLDRMLSAIAVCWRSGNSTSLAVKPGCGIAVYAGTPPELLRRRSLSGTTPIMRQNGRDEKLISRGCLNATTHDGQETVSEHIYSLACPDLEPGDTTSHRPPCQRQVARDFTHLMILSAIWLNDLVQLRVIDSYVEGCSACRH